MIMEELIQKIDELINAINNNSVPLWLSIIGILVPIAISLLVWWQSHQQNKKNIALQQQITTSEEKLQKLAEFIKQYARENNGESPSLADIMEYMGMVKSTAYRHILELEKRGIISYSGKNTLETPLQKKMHVMSRRIPVVGMIVCGTPDEQEEHISRYLAVPEEWLDGECFLLEAYGDSMVDIGVHAGDLVLVKKTNVANDGQVIVALTEEGNTLKRLHYENGKPVLYAENSSYTEKQRVIHPKELTIQGVALKVIKDIV